MANKPTMTVPQEESCVKLLRALRESGNLERLMEMANHVPMPSSSGGGAMHDGSKRRLVADEVSSLGGFEVLSDVESGRFSASTTKAGAHEDCISKGQDQPMD